MALLSEPAWSPLMCLPAADMTGAGLLKLDVEDGEVELMRIGEGAELRAESNMLLPNPNRNPHEEWKDRNVNLKVTLTTHRILLEGIGSSRFLHLSQIHAAVDAGGKTMISWNASAKVLISTYALGELLLCFKSSSSEKDQKEFLKLLQKSMERKAWESAARAQQKKSIATAISSRKVGVDAILAKNALRHKEAATLTEKAFKGDAEDLLAEAAELVAIIQKYVKTLESDQSKEDDTLQLTDLMSNMGMTSALSKESYQGNDFYEVLARQLCDFLEPRLKKVGTMTLTDVYCIYNRARGTNLISPEDLLAAVGYMSTLKLGISQREFPSGLKVVQSGDFSDEVMAEKLKNLSIAQGHLTSMSASRELHISALLANEQLLEAERMGFLCRDVTLETTKFYPNRFDEFWSQQ
jgi:ESCRT-II complex subunit VPS36